MVNDYNFVTPESEGISSDALIEFIEFFDELRINIHSFMIVRHGNIVAEGYYAPYGKDTKHRLYSCSKSITSLAIGKLYGEGLVDLDAPLVTYFPDVSACDTMKEVIVEDALKMCVPRKDLYYCKFPMPSDPKTVENADFAKTFFSDEGVADKPRGSLFRYNSHASSVLAELVLRVSGKNFLDYLRPVFDKIGVSPDIECIKTPFGVDWGASGVLATTRDFAKIGELVLNKGEYKGEELLPRDYMERATSKLADTVFGENVNPRCYGYGYQIWTEPYGFGLHGMRGQVVFCFPDKDIMVVINSNEPDYLSKYYYAASRIYKSAADAPLIENKKSLKKLSDVISSLKIDRSFGKAHSALEREISDKKYVLNENSMGISEFTLGFNENEGLLRFVMGGEEKTLSFGCGTYLDTFFPDKSFYGKFLNLKSDREFRTLSTGSWTMENRLLIMADISDDTLGSLGIVFEFSGDTVALEMRAGGEGILTDYNGTASGRQE